jgi:hemolysin III
MAKKQKRSQTPAEEKANTLTHGLGLLMVLITYPFLIQKAYTGGSIFSIIGVIMFFFGSVCMYAASTFYHHAKKEKLKLRLRVVDHISIFFLIGGTYSAVVQRYVPADTATWFMATMWGIIGLGSLLKLFFTGRFQWLSVMLYLFLGWMAVFIARPLNQHMPAQVFYWLLAGGLAYTFGVIFYKNQKLTYSHAIWHLFVLAGTFFHYIAIYYSYEFKVF